MKTTGTAFVIAVIALALSLNGEREWSGYLSLVALTILAFYWTTDYLKTHYPDEEEL